MALTKSVEAVDEWAEVAQNAVREGAIVVWQERSRCVWRVTDGEKVWKIETPPEIVGREKMPRPATEAN